MRDAAGPPVGTPPALPAPFAPEQVAAMANAFFAEAFRAPDLGAPSTLPTAPPADPRASAPPTPVPVGLSGPTPPGASAAPPPVAMPLPTPPAGAPPPMAAPAGVPAPPTAAPPAPLASAAPVPAQRSPGPAPQDATGLYFLDGRDAPPPTACATEGDLSTALASSVLTSVPSLGGPAEAEASRATEGKGAAAPWPMTPSAFGDPWLAGLFAAPTAAPPTQGMMLPPAGDAASLYFLRTPAAPAAPKVGAAPAGGFDVYAVRRDFPALQQTVHGKPLVWLDNAATTQKPRAVIDAISRFYERDNSNIHRAAHELARRATEAYEHARDTVRRFLGAGSAEEIVFVRGSTEAINLVAQSWGRQNVRAGDEILLTTLEHHANIVPWQMLAREMGAVLRVVPITDRGEIVLEEYARLLGPKTRLVGFPQVSNALGTVLPAREMTALAHRHGARVLVDGAQSVPHLPANVQDVGADFFVFSGHKVFGPTGVGALYAKKELLESMPPWQGGGSMIRTVTFEQTTYSDPPAKFEAGTPTIGDAVGLGAALEYVERLGIDRIAAHEHALLEYATGRLREIPGLRPIGTAPEKASVLSFVIEGSRVEDVGRHLDAEGIAVRAGHHCAMPTMQRYGLTGTVRPSLALYNTREDVDALIAALKRFRHA